MSHLIRCTTRCLMIAAALLPLGVRAQTATSCPAPKVYFVNGVWNFSAIDARNGSRALETAITENGGPPGLHIQTLYNPGDGLLEDVAEVATDNLTARGVLTFVNLTAVMADVALQGLPVISSIVRSSFGYGTISAWLQAHIDDAQARLRRAQIAAQVKAMILSKIQNDKTPVVLIAHSQGNIVVADVVNDLKTSVGADRKLSHF